MISCVGSAARCAHHCAAAAAGSWPRLASGVTVIVDSPRRGACSLTTPSSRSPASTAAPDMPDHCDWLSASCCGGNARGALVTCSDNNPPTRFSPGKIIPHTWAVSRTTPEADSISWNSGYPTAQQPSTGTGTGASRSTAATGGGGSSAISSCSSSSARSTESGSPASPSTTRARWGTLSGPRTRIPAAAPAMTCAAVSTSRPPSRNPDPYRYRSARPVPRAASISTTRSRSGTTGNATTSPPAELSPCAGPTPAPP
jgi:hypothetical protein